MVREAAPSSSSNWTHSGTPGPLPQRTYIQVGALEKKQVWLRERGREWEDGQPEGREESWLLRYKKLHRSQILIFNPSDPRPRPKPSSVQQVPDAFKLPLTCRSPASFTMPALVYMHLFPLSCACTWLGPPCPHRSLAWM